MYRDADREWIGWTGDHGAPNTDHPLRLIHPFSHEICIKAGLRSV